MTKQELRDRLVYIIQELDAMDGTPEGWSEAGISAHDAQEYFTPRQAQKYLSLPPSTFYALVRQGHIPPGRYVGPKSRRWTRAELDRGGAAK